MDHGVRELECRRLAWVLALVLLGAATSAFGSSKHFDIRLSMGAEQNNRLVTVTDDFVEEIGATTSQQGSDLALLDTQLEFSLRYDHFESIREGETYESDLASVTLRYRWPVPEP